LPYDLILRALICGFHFRATDPAGKPYPGDTIFYEHLIKGTDHVLMEICGFEREQHAAVFEAATILLCP
jgi:hypothetical protein